MLPEKYNWLNTIGELPQVVHLALQYLGIKEVPGKGSNPIILNMAEHIGLKEEYTDDDISWCAVFRNFLASLAGEPLSPTNGDKYNLMRANSFSNWGTGVNPPTGIVLGDTVVISRPGGFHVFIAIAVTPTGNVIGLGGNQSNSVTFAEFDKARIVAVRRSPIPLVPSQKKYIMDGEKMSTSEA